MRRHSGYMKTMDRNSKKESSNSHRINRDYDSGRFSLNTTTTQLYLNPSINNRYLG